MDDQVLKHEISVRFQQARKALGMKPPALAKELGSAAQTIRDYEDAKSIPGGAVIAGLCELNINPHWLLTGYGSMWADGGGASNKDSLEVRESPPGHAVDSTPHGYISIPLFNNIRAAAGHGAVVSHEAADDALMFKEDWIRFELGARPQDLRLIRVSGDSMEPTLRAGDVILVDHRAQRPDREGIYILRMDGMLLVKRIQAMPGGVVTISSDNPAFSPWVLKVADLNGDDVAIVGRVVWSGRRL